ncbi:Dolichyl-phosphate-mannose-protein mannosyltransferase-domain-containing protein [Halteromyces radiatus]|uniref:Dolichyl-phosphate-mannose-protein mannosyltransferase-domain-containing protein n=1 Tax=Halteromyces radiatus TaxID=101107 RepID=UPI00221E4F86|nr:Dolichyl-phosphate-mannose-protein mannosyltransferase-domain-containing protein [Halteromyces radiatus]KAI8089425.1 Dolichyl-phosphate-mannose-protein mannosyltransferase-domain-containing protein [Halteromyces radiatus]
MILTGLSFWTRLRLIDRSNIVIWDEAHFGKFGSHYIEHEYYTDVHPPLGKLLVAFSGWLANFDGAFKFESGAEYPEGMDYRTMRIFSASWGAMMVPLAYLTARKADYSILASILGATMVLCDTAYLTISRFVLLDSMLLFFTCLTCYSLFGFHHQQDHSFSLAWWSWLSLIGVSLGCVLSVKWVGLFAVGLVGIYTLQDLWDKLADMEMSRKTYVSHWSARALCLIILPIIIYLVCFKIHFDLLYKSGTGDDDMSPLFQAHLEGNAFGESALELAFGSNITIRTLAPEQSLLHSHHHTYPEGSEQHQVTGYYFQDENNHWLIRLPRNDDINYKNFDITHNSRDYDDLGVRYINDGDIIRLNHMATSRNLHSHSFASPNSNNKQHFLEVSAYGDDERGDVKDNWKIEVVKHLDSYSGSRIHTMATHFRLRHVELGCLLAVTQKRLPVWGYYQMEIGCASNAEDINDLRTVWMAETNQHEKLSSPPQNTYKYHFFRDFWYLNKLMWRSNNALIPDPDKEDILSSTPTQWPMVGVGLRMCRWDDDTIKFFLLGNPMVWWTSFISVITFTILHITYIVREKRQIHDKEQARWNQSFSIGKSLLLGWFLHYIPFYIMGRVMYLHHYFPALYFSILLVPFLLDHFTAQSNGRQRFLIFGILMILVISNFIYFSPFSYGMDGPIDAYSGRSWMKWWNLTKKY